jgi:SEC-C motif-containing protein
MNYLNRKCPCGSGLKYKKCCQVYHLGKRAPNALILMKSRYSAYAFSQLKYIEKTTYQIKENLEDFRRQVLAFSQNTDFKGLKILNFSDEGDKAFVTFHAQLSSSKQDLSFTEKSSFIKENDTWYYVEGVLEE